MCKSKTLEVFSSTLVARTAPSSHGFTVGHTSYAHGSTNGQNLYFVLRERHRLAQHTGPALAALHPDLEADPQRRASAPGSPERRGRGPGPRCCSARRTDTHCRPNRFAINCTPLGDHQLQTLPRPAQEKWDRGGGGRDRTRGRCHTRRASSLCPSPGTLPAGRAVPTATLTPTSAPHPTGVSSPSPTVKGPEQKDWAGLTGDNEPAPTRTPRQDPPGGAAVLSRQSRAQREQQHHSTALGTAPDAILTHGRPPRGETCPSGRPHFASALRSTFRWEAGEPNPGFLQYAITYTWVKLRERSQKGSRKPSC